ncbi:MAG: hypothetical protein GY941_11505 [Planctomycetes bacterium]|nr:hypothetical protein [Planctomycetota bacterium]
MRINEVVSELQKNPGGSFSAVSYDEKNLKLSVYMASNEEDDPEWITVSYEGGELFSTCGEEGVFSIDEIPAEVSLLDFKPSYELTDLSGGFTADYLAFKLFPKLPNPETIFTEQQRFAFSSELARMFSKGNY